MGDLYESERVDKGPFILEDPPCGVDYVAFRPNKIGSWCEIKLRRSHWRSRNDDDERARLEPEERETLHGDEHKGSEIQRIIEVIVKERLTINGGVSSTGRR
jgi:hypothetical protein